MAQGKFSRAAIWLLVAVSALGLAVSVFNYFWTGNGIHGSLGALIVIGSTLLMALASAAIAVGFARGWVRSVLAVLILLDILGTGFAAYMLEAQILLGLMILALIAWPFSAFSDRRLSRRAATLEAAT
jgi:glycerol-3-phosphate acyltransferase PlsY